MHDCSGCPRWVIPCDRDAPASVTDASGASGVWADHGNRCASYGSEPEELVIYAVTFLKRTVRTTHQVSSLHATTSLTSCGRCSNH